MGNIDKTILKEIYPKREKTSHKFDFGHLLVIGGNNKYSGSPTFNSLAGYRAGVDLVTTVCPRRAADIVANFSPDLITVPLEGAYFKPEHLKEIDKIENYDAVVIGGGLGRKERTFEAVDSFLKKLNKPCVVDADAIHAVAKRPEIIKNKPFVLTPHAYEFYILTGKKVRDKNRKDLVKKYSSKLKTTILLKGHSDVVSNGEEITVNKTGSPFMSTGGTGDVLVGILGAYLARGVEEFKAAYAAAYLNGRIGEIIGRRKKESLMASDLIKGIPEVLRKEI